MARYYKVYDADHDFRLICEGSYVGLTFAYPGENADKKIPMVYDDELDEGTVLLNRPMAESLQRKQVFNRTFYTDLMDRFRTNTLAIRVFP